MNERPDVTNLFEIDRAVERAARAVAQWRARLVTDPKNAVDDDPYEAHRAVAGKALYDALSALTPSLVDVPLRDALRRWVGELTLGRVSGEAEARRTEALLEPSLTVRLEKPRTVSVREALHGLLAAPTNAEAALWLDAWSGGAGEASAAERERAEIRAEAARRLGLEHPVALALEGPMGALREAAESALRATHDLAHDLVREQRKRDPDAIDLGLVAYLGVARARDASEGWPPRLNERWLFEVFSSLRFPRAVPLTLPSVVGASSFARALEEMGAASARAFTPKALPFALRATPFAPRHRVLATVFGSLAASPAFQARVLGLGRGRAADQARIVGRSLLLEARARAVRVLLSDPVAPATKVTFEELTAALFGAPLAPALRGVWPLVRDDEAVRFAALLEAPAVVASLERELDDDWFRNPRLARWVERFAVAAPPSASSPAGLLAALERLVA